MEFFAKMVINYYQLLLTIFAKSSIINVSQGLKHICAKSNLKSIITKLAHGRLDITELCFVSIFAFMQPRAIQLILYQAYSSIISDATFLKNVTWQTAVLDYNRLVLRFAKSRLLLQYLVQILIFNPVFTFLKFFSGSNYLSFPRRVLCQDFSSYSQNHGTPQSMENQKHNNRIELVNLVVLQLLLLLLY